MEVRIDRPDTSRRQITEIGSGAVLPKVVGVGILANDRFAGCEHSLYAFRLPGRPCKRPRGKHGHLLGMGLRQFTRQFDGVFDRKLLYAEYHFRKNGAPGSARITALHSPNLPSSPS